MTILRRIVAAVAVLGLATAAGCAGGRGQELVSSDADQYSSPVWVGETVYYLAQREDGSDTPPRLMRVRDGGRPEQVTVEHPDCPDPRGLKSRLRKVLAVSGHELGLVMSCRGTGADASAAVVRWDADTGRSTVVGKVGHSGGVAWSGGEGTVYYPTSSCPQNLPAGALPSTCLGEPDAMLGDVAADGSLVYLTTRCGTDAPGPESVFPVYSVCRRVGRGPARTVARAVQAPSALTVHGDRIVLAGEANGKAGVWLVKDGRFERIARGRFLGVAFNADGTRLAVADEDKGWFSMTWSLRVIPAPPAQVAG
ncbi:hypothetical protein [Dactylosporangium sp. NPDC006015]|uniref:hypothetical protein n=1 Tax=Dactylosporangium sp. NPDC006015 TaxID=3154576 RepID=UPI0033B0AFAF